MKLGEVIMTRELERDGKTVLVQIGRPMPLTPGERDHYVPFQIDGLDQDGQVLMAGGVDSVQAMLFALAMIGDLLRSYQGLTFLGTQPGFPVTAPEEGMYVAIHREPVDMSLLEGSA